MKFSYKTQGFTEVQRALKALPDRMATRVIQTAVRKGAAEVRDAVEAGAPVGDMKHPQFGHLKDNIRLKKVEANREHAAYVVHTGPAFWARFFELGTPTQPARPFMRPIFDSFAGKTFNTIVQEVSKGLAREAKKLAADYKTAAKAMGVGRK